MAFKIVSHVAVKQKRQGKVHIHSSHKYLATPDGLIRLVQTESNKEHYSYFSVFTLTKELFITRCNKKITTSTMYYK